MLELVLDASVSWYKPVLGGMQRFSCLLLYLRTIVVCAMVLVVVLHAARVEHTKVLRSAFSWTEEEISRVSVVLVPTKNATKNHLAIVEGVQPTNSKLGGLKLPKAILKQS